MSTRSRYSQWTDDIAERVRKVGGTTIRSVGHITGLKRVDNDAEYVGPLDMLGELREDNEALAARMIQIHDLCDETNDVATASFAGELDRSNATPALVSV
jgi:starvation-inducible DNA-binding protein